MAVYNTTYAIPSNMSALVPTTSERYNQIGLDLLDFMVSTISSSTLISNTLLSKIDSRTSATSAFSSSTLIPEWVRVIYPTYTNLVVGCFSFTVNNVKFAIVSSVVASQYTYVDVFVDGTYHTNLPSRKKYSSFIIYNDSTGSSGAHPGSVITIQLIEKVSCYWGFRKTSNDSSSMNTNFTGILFVEPINNSDISDLFVLCLPAQGNIFFSKAFANENTDLLINCFSDEIIPSATGFLANLYTSKTPLHTVWVGTSTYGIRGKLRGIIAVPIAFTVGPGNYTIDGKSYYGSITIPLGSNSGYGISIPSQSSFAKLMIEN